MRNAELRVPVEIDEEFVSFLRSRMNEKGLGVLDSLMDQGEPVCLEGPAEVVLTFNVWAMKGMNFRSEPLKKAIEKDEWRRLSGIGMPISEEELRACCQPEYLLSDAIDAGARDCFGGLDWRLDAESMESYTVFTIYAIVNRRFQLQYVRKFTAEESARPNFVLAHILEKAREHNVQIIGGDWGVGHKENQRIAKEYGARRVLEYQYAMQSEEIKYDDDREVFMLDRASRMKNFFEAMKQQWVWFPAWPEFASYAEDIGNIYSAHNEFLDTETYLHRGPDDFFHSSLYAWEAMNYYYQYKVQFGAGQKETADANL